MVNSGGEEDEMQEEAALETSLEESVDIFEDKLRELVESSQIDFDAWTSLIAEIEKTTPNNIKRISQVYDYFLSEFPLCYGYWIRYANHKARLCNFYEVQAVYDRAVQAVAYSVDLWVSYCSFAVMSYEDPSDIRRLFERGLSFVGKDYFCHFLWDKYIEFEYSQKEWSCLAHIYINTLRFPTKNLENYYECFKRLCAMWEENVDFFNNNKVMPSESVPTTEVLDAEACKRVVISNIIKLLFDENDDHPRPDMVKRYLSVGELLYQLSSEIDSNISCFEARIRRHYFHVKPLDDGQLENWHKYLDFVELQGDFDWAIKLYERCLIACAHYLEFWIRYVDFANAKGGKELADFALARASNVFLKKIPAFHVHYAIFKEQHGDISSARASLSQCGANSSLDLIEIVNRQANMERRMGNSEEAFMVYEKAIEMAMEKDDCYTLSVLYSDLAQFTHVVHGSIDAAREVFVKGIQQKPCRPIVEAMIRFITVHGGPGQIPFVDSVVAAAINPDSDISWSLSSNDREDISKLFLKFVDLYGTVQEIRKAWDRHIKLFPNKMKPSGYGADTEKIVLDKINELRSLMLVVSPHHLTGDDSRYGPDVHMVENPSLKNHCGDMPEEVVMHASQVEVNRSPATGTAEDADGTAEMQRTVVEEVKLHEELMLSIHESSAGFRTPEGQAENHTTASQFHGCTGTESIECMRLPAMDNLLINSSEGESQKIRPTASHDNGAQESSKFNGDISEDNDVMGELSAINISRSSSSPQVMLGKDSPLPPSNGKSQLGPRKDYSPLHQSSGKNSEEALRSPLDEFPVTQMPTSSRPSEENLEKDCSLWCSASERSSREAQERVQLQRQPLSMSSSQQASPTKGSSPHDLSTDGKSAQIYDNRRSPIDSPGKSHGFVQSPQPPHIQIAPQLQYGPAVTNPQTLIAQTYPFQFQAWTNTQQGQQANQIQGQYQMAIAQFYPMSTVAWPGTNMMHQSFVYGQPQASGQPASQPQVQVYQYPLQGNEQYECPQSSQGLPPYVWQFCQQQLYYLQQQQQQQQQQNQQVNQTQLQLQIEHWKQLQQVQLQQNQQPPEQIEQQNQHEVDQNETQNLSDQEKHEQGQQQKQQQHLYQYQQQGQQIDHQQQQQQQSPQQQYLLYLQQQQLYLQQQQLFWQQQQQQMLQQQQQHQNQLQQLPQQQQILQQQQMLQQQLHQQQEQSTALDFQALHNSYYLQQALLLQQHAASQHAQYHGQQDVSQGESTKTHDTYQSAAASPSADQQAH